MTQCYSTTWTTGCCSFHHVDIVSFDNIKSKYFVNEDIHVEYTLHGHVQQASTRDWLGIFPRGWTNLQQYLTFEYALVAPRAAASSNRTIIFPRVFHQEASMHTEYQLVYVSREIQVLATSSYFRFIEKDRTDTVNHILRVPYIRAGTSAPEKREIQSDQFVNSSWAPPHIVLSDQSLISIRPSKKISANPRLPGTCRSCGRPRENIACGLAASRARFLATQNASLAERVVHLERNLELAEGGKCSLKERLRSYENFVGEMLRSIATKGIVKITDALGKELILQRMPIAEDSEVKVTDELKNFGNEMGRGESTDPKTNDSAEKEELSTNDQVLIDKHPSVDETLPMEDDQGAEKPQDQLVEDSKSDSAGERKRSSADVETQTEGTDAECTAGNTSETRHYEDSIEGTSSNDQHKERAVEEAGVETLETSVIDHDDQKVTTDDDKEDCTDGVTEKKSNVVLDDGSKSLQTKPSAIVIRGGNVKFAIIRY